MSVDPPPTSAELAGKLGLTFPLLADEKRETVRAYGVEDGENGVAWPALFVIAPDGRIAWRSLSETYKERAAPAEILRALDRLRRADGGVP